jgi:putative membrane protein
MNEHNINPDLILREKLAIQRTILANQTTLLAFLRTSMYFMLAGLSISNLLHLAKDFMIVYSLYVISLIVLIYGIVNFFIQKKKIKEIEVHIGNYKFEYGLKKSENKKD